MTSAIILLLGLSLSAQSNGLSVYKILQDHCASCHSNGSPEANLDLEGMGSTDNQKWASVRNNILNVAPANVVAAAKGDSYVFPGRPDRSYLFRKLNNGLDEQLGLDPGEDNPMPNYNSTILSDSEKEIIRQWILFGADLNGNAFDEDYVKSFYEEGGQEAFPNGPPPAPAPEDGFQVKFGPFFLAPGSNPNESELEFFHKYQLDLPDDTEVVALDHLFSGSSHHFIVYKYNTPDGATNIPEGLRLESYHDDIELVTAVQQSERIDLPQGAAFNWDKDAILDLNSHYINYSVNEVYKAEAYLNVYTQEKGTAAQEMKTELIPNLGIFIPNDEELVTNQQTLSNFGLGDIYLWGLMGHTHKYGRDYKVWTREDGQASELIYDASCPEAVPGCSSPNFDYQHIPLRLYEPFIPVSMTGTNGLIHQASWLNDGPSSVFFGPTSDDEMMVLVMMYLEDIEGVTVSTDTDEIDLPKTAIKVFPNPMQDYTEFVGPANGNASNLRLMDGLGKTIYQASSNNSYFRFQQNNLPKGIYFYEMHVDGFAPVAGKLVVQ